MFKKLVITMAMVIILFTTGCACFQNDVIYPPNMFDIADEEGNGGGCE